MHFLKPSFAASLTLSKTLVTLRTSEASPTSPKTTVSNGMILASQDKNKVKLIPISKTVANGTSIS